MEVEVSWYGDALCSMGYEDYITSIGSWIVLCLWTSSEDLLSTIRNHNMDPNDIYFQHASNLKHRSKHATGVA